MKELHKKIILYSIAILFLIISLSTIIIHFIQGTYSSIFWTCYIFMILVPIGIFLKKPKLILSQIAIMLIPNILWTIDFIIMLISGNSPLGLARYIFLDERLLISNILSLHHLIAIPLAIIALAIMKPKKSNGYLKISFLEMSILFILGLTVPWLEGINCLPETQTCITVSLPQFIPFPIIWIVITSSFILISHLIINYFLKKFQGLKH